MGSYYVGMLSPKCPHCKKLLPAYIRPRKYGCDFVEICSSCGSFLKFNRGKSAVVLGFFSLFALVFLSTIVPYENGNMMIFIVIYFWVVSFFFASYRMQYFIVLEKIGACDVLLESVRNSVPFRLFFYCSGVYVVVCVLVVIYI